MDRYTHVREARISAAAERFDTVAVSRALADEA
jgi:hypothetical protein